VLALAFAYSFDPARLARLRPKHVAAATLAVIVAFALVPRLREVASDSFTILVDLRNYDPNAAPPGLAHGPRGAMMYLGAFKKAFVQSLPWLPLASAAPFFRGAPRRELAALGVPFVAHAGVFAGLGWHGGLCLNLRYLLPAIPFASILATYAAYRLLRRTPAAVARLRELDVGVLSLVAAWFLVAVVVVLPSSLSVQEIFYLDAPLALAALLACALLARRTGAALGLASLAFVWAGMTELTYDAVATLRARAANEAVAARVRAVVPRGAVVFAEYPDLVSGALEHDVVVAQPSLDRDDTVGTLAAAARSRGRAAYVVLTPRSIERVRVGAGVRLGDAVATTRGFEIRALEAPDAAPRR
jgi:hypothetical protein